MKLGTKVKVIIGIVSIVAVGFIGFQVSKFQSPDIERTQRIINTVRLEGRRIITSPFVEGTFETETETQQESGNIKSPEVETIPVPESVPTAQSSDAEIREFQAWLSSILEQADTVEGVQQEDFTADVDEVDYDLERSVIESVIADQWENSLEAYDIEGYMSAIWEDEFFYASDLGTPENPDDDIIFRSGQQEREAALNMFDTMDDIELDLYKNDDIEFLSDTLAMADYDYRLKLALPTHGATYPSGRMIFILEQRDNGEWRILEWYDYATPDP